MPQSRFGFLSAPKSLSPQERKGIAEQRQELNAMLRAVEFMVGAQQTPAASPRFAEMIEVARRYIEENIHHHVKVEAMLGTREGTGELPPEIHTAFLALTHYNEILAANWVIARTAFQRLTQSR